MVSSSLLVKSRNSEVLIGKDHGHHQSKQAKTTNRQPTLGRRVGKGEEHPKSKPGGFPQRMTGDITSANEPSTRIYRGKNPLMGNMLGLTCSFLFDDPDIYNVAIEFAKEGRFSEKFMVIFEDKQNKPPYNCFFVNAKSFREALMIANAAAEAKGLDPPRLECVRFRDVFGSR